MLKVTSGFLCISMFRFSHLVTFFIFRETNKFADRLSDAFWFRYYFVGRYFCDRSLALILNCFDVVSVCVCVLETPLLYGTQFLIGLVVNRSQMKSLDGPLSHDSRFMNSELAFLQAKTVQCYLLKTNWLWCCCYCIRDRHFGIDDRCDAWFMRFLCSTCRKCFLVYRWTVPSVKLILLIIFLCQNQCAFFTYNLKLSELMW